MRTLILVVSLAALSAAGCGGDDGGATGDSGVTPDAGAGDGAAPDAGVDAGPWMPDGYCPGSEGCPDEGDDVLYAGAAAVEVTPTIDDTTDVQTVDVDGDGEFDYPEDEFDDRNGNGKYDAVWIAGFGNARGATGVHDPQWARSIALRHNETTIVLTSIDCVGYFKDEMDEIRDMVSDLDVDYVMIAATHSHEARDTLGIWGISEAETGIDPDYMAFLREQAAQSIRDAVADLRPANVQYASFRVRDLPGGIPRYVGDNRDPNIVDDEVRVLRFVEAGADATIATMVNWAAHPEYAGSHNTLLSSDFPHWIRDGIENGVDGPDGSVDGIGGTAVYFSAALGGQIGPNHIQLERWDGTLVPDGEGLDAPEVLGQEMAYFILEALADGGGSVTDETAPLGFKNRSFFVDIQNRGYHVALLGDLFQRQTYHFDPDLPLVPGENEPDVLTEIAVIDIGRARLVTIPGELHPELWVGGYDGSFTPEGQDIVDPDNENPPDLDAAPDGPYLREIAAGGEFEYVMPVGLADDMIGYLMPDYNYILDRSNPYLDEAPGDHYEETNSVGIDGWGNIEGEIHALIDWTPEE